MAASAGMTELVGRWTKTLKRRLVSRRENSSRCEMLYDDLMMAWDVPGQSGAVSWSNGGMSDGARSDQIENAWPAPVRLAGRHAVLEPLALSHVPALAESSADGDLASLWYTSVPKPEDMQAAVEARLGAQKAGQLTPFAVVAQATGKAVGMTCYLNPVPTVRRLEIGGTWYRRAVQRSPLNTECKLLLLTHAFETLDCIAVEFRTHFFNRRSRRAIERLGAKLDGILRSHFDPAGNIRDTCVYSIIAGEWPQVKRHLGFLLGQNR
jgi:RimJ/RimL family protein N-acetyltransferase